jgi:hypothetical protein
MLLRHLPEYILWYKEKRQFNGSLEHAELVSEKSVKLFFLQNILTCLLLGLFFDPKGGDNTLLRNVNELILDYPISHQRNAAE